MLGIGQETHSSDDDTAATTARKTRMVTTSPKMLSAVALISAAALRLVLSDQAEACRTKLSVQLSCNETDDMLCIQRRSIRAALWFFCQASNDDSSWWYWVMRSQHCASSSGCKTEQSVTSNKARELGERRWGSAWPWKLVAVVVMSHTSGNGARNVSCRSVQSKLRVESARFRLEWKRLGVQIYYFPWTTRSF